MLTPARLRGLAMVVYALTAAAALDGLALLVGLVVGTVLFVLTAPRWVPHELPRYQLQHRSSGRVDIVAASDDEAAGRVLFHAQATALEAAGARGQLVLVDRITGHPVTWRVL